MLSLSNRSGLAIAALAAAGFTSAANADLFTWNFVLDGASESPPVATPGIGSGTITWDSVTHMMNINVAFSGLIGVTTAAHIHAATALAGSGNAGVASNAPSYPGFPLGVSSGVFIAAFDLSNPANFHPSFLANNGGTAAGAEAAMISAMMTNRAYFNIHTSAFNSGEIRGLIPTPGTAALLGLAGIAAVRRRR
jgi:hypothetical protein